MSTAKYESLVKILRKEVGRLPSGSRFPSVRQLMREHRVSQATVDRALSLLKEEGVLVANVGSGTCTARGVDGPVFRVLLFVHDYPTVWGATLIASLTDRLTASGHSIRCVRYAYQQKPWRYLPRSGYDILLVLPSFRDEGSFLELQRRAGVPVVLMDEEPFKSGKISTIGTNNVLGGRMAADHLAELGHRQLAVLIAEPNTSTIRARVSGFCKRIAELGLPSATILDNRTRHGDDAMAAAHRCVSKALPNREFTGLFVTSDPTALGALKAIHDNGLAIPGDLSVIGFDGMPESAYFYPSLTTLQQDIRGWADAVVALLHGDFSHTLSRQFSPRLLMRDSTGPLT